MKFHFLIILLVSIFIMSCSDDYILGDISDINQELEEKEFLELISHHITFDDLTDDGLYRISLPDDAYQNIQMTINSTTKIVTLTGKIPITIEPAKGTRSGSQTFIFDYENTFLYTKDQYRHYFHESLDPLSPSWFAGFVSKIPSLSVFHSKKTFMMEDVLYKFSPCITFEEL